MNLVFDFGGVLFRWRPHELVRRVLSHRVADESVAHAVANQFFEGYPGEWGCFDRGIIEVPELVSRISQRTGLTLTEVQAVIEAVPEELQPQLATVDLLNRLQSRGHSLFFLSNMPLPLADMLERSHHFLTVFTDGVFSSRVKLIKPQPEIFELAVRRFGIDPAETLFLDDALQNVEAARTLGWQVHQFLDAPRCEADLRARSLL